MRDLEKLFVGELQDMYDAEQQLVKTLPTMSKEANAPGLKNAFSQHLEQTKGHVSRLERVFSLLGQEPRRRNCKGMEGIIDEGEVLAKEYHGNEALDAALIAAGQKVEHYEITSYGCLCTWANQLGLTDVLPLLKQNLSEEKETDKTLTELAESVSNEHAASHDTKKRGEMSAMAAKMVSSGP